MNNFGRVLRLALRYRWTFAASFSCALAVAVLWGGNIGALFPFIEVAFKGHSMHEWVDGEAAKAQAAAGQLAGEIAALEDELNAAPPGEQGDLKKQIGLLTSRRQAELAALDRYRRLAPWIHAYFPATAFQTLILVVVVLLLGTLVKDLFLIAGTMLVERLTQRTTFDLRKQFFRRTLRMELASFDRQGTSELMTRFTHDTERLADGLQTLFGRATREPLKMLACLVGAGMICWRLLLLSLVLAPIAALVIGRLTRLLKRANHRAMQEMSQLYALLRETFDGVKVVKTFTMEPYERARFHRTCKAYYRRAMKIARYDALVKPVTELMGVVTICMAILGGAYLVLNQQTHLLGIKMCDRPLGISSLMVFFGLLAGVSDPARKMSNVYSMLQKAAAAADRIYELLDREPTITDPPRSVPLARHHRDIVLEGVHFGYRADLPVLEAIDLRIPFGQTLAIVGPNGSGKSTLANLLPRLFDPTVGRILLDGVDLRHARLRGLRGQISMVSQETLLFDDTVYNNIRYGAPSASREEIVAAARRAHADRFIEQQLDDGYATRVGPGGNRLSGGQRQRIALARAILSDPAIMILDEATSQVDPESEQLIHKVLKQFIRHRTTIIITHRMSTLDLADRILVLDAGRIADQGTHAELFARCGLYQRLYQSHLRESA